MKVSTHNLPYIYIYDLEGYANKNAYTNPDNPFIVIAQRIFTYAIVLVTIISIKVMPGL